MSDQQSQQAEINYSIWDRGDQRVLEIDLALGDTSINVITPAPVDLLHLSTVLSTLPTAVQRALGQLQPEEIKHG